MTSVPTNAIPFQRSRRRAPHEPHDVVAESDFTGIKLRWQQRGIVDGWTVYCDPMDGSETDSAFVTEASYRFTDLAPGEHHLGVVAWNHGRPSDGAGTWVYASVVQQPEDRPAIPVITDVTTGGRDISLSWSSPDAEAWQVRLVDSAQCVLDLRETTTRTTHLADLQPQTPYGLQVRAMSPGLEPSAWCDVAWSRTTALTPIP